jgi:hypothetical protein
MAKQVIQTRQLYEDLYGLGLRNKVSRLRKEKRK